MEAGFDGYEVLLEAIELYPGPAIVDWPADGLGTTACLVRYLAK